MPSVSSRIDRSTVVPIAQSLIAIPSVSGDERGIMKWVSGWCRERGLSVQEVNRDDARPNLIVSIGDPDSGPTLVMNGHLDTVPVSDADAWRTDPFDPVVSDDGKRLFGRGSSDMKASTGVMLAMMELFSDVPIRGCLQAHIVSDEELSGHFGTIAVIEAIENGLLPRPDWCLIGEKSDLKVRNAERGILGINVTVHGKASHTAAARASGINAIALASKAIVALEQDLDKFHPSVGKPVISINTISGGVAHNVVPGECTFSIDRRLIPGETLESAVAEIESVLADVTLADNRFRYTLDVDPDGDFIAAEYHRPRFSAGADRLGRSQGGTGSGTRVFRAVGRRNRRTLLPPGWHRHRRAWSRRRGCPRCQRGRLHRRPRCPSQNLRPHNRKLAQSHLTLKRQSS